MLHEAIYVILAKQAVEMDRRTVLRSSLAFTLPLTAGCLGASSASNEENTENENAIDMNETYGLDREGKFYDLRLDQQMQLAFGDGVIDGGVSLIAHSIEWAGSEHSPQVRVYFEWRNETNSTLTSPSKSYFSLYEDGTSNELDDLYGFGDDAYKGGKSVQPGTSDEGYLFYDADDEFETLRAFRFALHVPMQSEQTIDIAWTVADDEAGPNK